MNNIIIILILYFLFASITTFDIRLVQGQKDGSIPLSHKLPVWVGIFHILEWGILIYLAVINWKFAVLLYIIKFVLKVLPILEIIGSIIMIPFYKKN